MPGWKKAAPSWFIVPTARRLRRSLCTQPFAFLGLFLCATVTAGSPGRLLNTNDVIAFVGGEDVVAMQQYGYVEVMLAREIAVKNLRFRNLGWEGDTVFEQRRELNFPAWEQTLAKIGATVIVAQFGQVESLRGREALPSFGEAAEKLLTRLAGTNRLVIVLAPTPFARPPGALPDLTTNNVILALYSDELRSLCGINQWRFVDAWTSSHASSHPLTRDGLHLSAEGHWRLAFETAAALRETRRISTPLSFLPSKGRFASPAAEQLRQAIIAKNKLWFDYWRPQNWAFLAGDRTEQPSSRDHRNPKLRWFPNEMEQFLPLIEAKEREVRELAGRLP
jgi:hypothetical protein